MRDRGLLLLATVVLAVALAACGRATEGQIDQALGITPTPTRSAAEIANGTAAVAATEAARAATQTTPDALALGDATRGQRQFTTWCVGCHRPGGSGPNVLEPGSPGSSVTAESLLALVREGTGHPEGLTYPSTQISDGQVDDLATYIRSRAGQ